MRNKELDLVLRKLEEELDLPDRTLEEELFLALKKMEEEVFLLLGYNFDNNIRPENENVEKDELPESKNVGKDELPENENVEKDELPESKNVGKDELHENENVEKDELPESKNVGNDELFFDFGFWDEPITIPYVGTEEAGANNQGKVKKQKASGNYCRFSPGTKLFGTVGFFYLISSCAADSTMSDGPNKQQDLSEIYKHTLKRVENCPNVNEYRRRAFDKCADVCGANMQDGECAYHCMRDSSKTNLYEFCAKPEPLFDYCPEFDPVDQTIQKDHETLCNSSFPRRIYNSSEIFFCDPGSCLKLIVIESTVRTVSTTPITLMAETTEMKSGDIQHMVFVLPVSIIIVALVLAVFIFVICRRNQEKCFACLKKLTKSPNDIEMQKNTPFLK